MMLENQEDEDAAMERASNNAKPGGGNVTVMREEEFIAQSRVGGANG